MLTPDHLRPVERISLALASLILLITSVSPALAVQPVELFRACIDVDRNYQCGDPADIPIPDFPIGRSVGGDVNILRTDENGELTLPPGTNWEEGERELGPPPYLPGYKLIMHNRHNTGVDFLFEPDTPPITTESG